MIQINKIEKYLRFLFYGFLSVTFLFVNVFTASAQQKYQQATADKVLGLNHPLYEIKDVATNNGTIIIITNGEKNLIKLFNDKGFIRSFGKKGPGPYEFHNPKYLCSWGNQISVLDFQLGKNKIVSFSLKGSRLKEIPLRDISMANGLSCFQGQQLVLAGQFKSREKTVWLTKSQKKIFTYLVPEPITIHPPGGPMNSYSLTAPFEPEYEWEIIGLNKFIVWDGSSSKLYKISFEEDTLSSMPLSDLNIPVTAQDMEYWVNRTYPAGEVAFGHSDFNKGIRAWLFDYSGYSDFPTVMQIRKDDFGGIWILRARKKEGQIMDTIKRK